MNKTYTLLIFIMLLSVIGCSSSGQVIASKNTDEKVAEPAIDQKDLNNLAEKLCIGSEHTALTQNRKKQEFFGRMVGDEQIAEMGYESLDEFIDESMVMVEHLIKKRPNPELLACKTAASSISCDEVINILKEGSFYGHFGLTDDILAKRIKIAMKEMNIQSCAVVDFVAQTQAQGENNHYKFFTTDFGNGLQVFYALDVDMIGKGHKVIKTESKVTPKYREILSISEQIDAQWIEVERQLNRRFDLIFNLDKVSDKFTAQESAIYDNLIEDRNAYNNAEDLDGKVQAASQFSSELYRLIVSIEMNPEHKSDVVLQDFMVSLEATQNRIAVERMRFNDQVTFYNAEIKEYPELGFEEKQLFKIIDQ